jgi:hypothetical protein
MMKLTQIYNDETIRRMKQMASSLSERDRRAYAAAEAYKIGRGGVRAIARLFGMSTETIKRGKDDLDSPGRLPAPGRQRHAGAGRKGICFEQEGLDAAFDALVKSRLGGDPMNPDVIWTDLQPSGIAAALAKQGFSISENTVRALLKKKHIRKRTPAKTTPTGRVDPDLRNAQFENIEKLRARYEKQGWPVLSVDTKKKEFLGGLYRKGKLYSQDGVPLKRFDHDFPHLAEGRVVPHGIFDLNFNKGFITLGTSAQTPAFVAESLGLWWNYRGRYDYPGAGRVLLLMDAGGANAARNVQFKHEMLKLAARTGLEIRVAHYPPYCSKWNPVEHRLFPHVTRSIQGVYLDSPQTMRRYINERATTSTGLETRAYVLDKVFERGVKEDIPLPEGLPLEKHDKISGWNFTFHPSDYYESRN